HHASRPHAVHKPVSEFISRDFEVSQRFDQFFAGSRIPDDLSDNASLHHSDPQPDRTARLWIEPRLALPVADQVLGLLGRRKGSGEKALDSLGGWGPAFHFGNLTARRGGTGRFA